MARYVYEPGDEWYLRFQAKKSSPAPKDVHVNEKDSHERTGLLDSKGRPIYKETDRVPFGFQPGGEHE